MFCADVIDTKTCESAVGSLRYQLLREAEQGGQYAIAIASEKEYCLQTGVCTSLSQADEWLARLVSGAVRPCQLAEVIGELLCE